MTAEQIAYSYAHWWREAGLDCATDDAPRRWRDGEPVPFWRQQRETTQPDQRSTPQQSALQPRSFKPAASPSAPKPRAPETLAAFLEWLALDDAQPEAAWHGPLITPPTLETPRLLFVVEMPSASAQDHMSLLESDQQRFVSAMLAAIGFNIEDVPCVSLAMRPAPGGHLDDQTVATLGNRMKRYLNFVRPGAVILLGDRTSRAILGDTWRPGSISAEKIDLPGGSVNIVPLASLDLLMNRPITKAKSWKILRSLHGQLIR